MNHMNIFRPDRRKIIFSFVIFSILPFFLKQAIILCKPGAPCPPMHEYVSLISLFFTGFSGLSFSIITILGAGISYFISSVAMHYAKPLDLVKIKDYLRPTKGKLIIASLGWLTVCAMFNYFLMGIYRGVPNFPPALKQIYTFTEAMNYVLLPFALVSIYIMFNLLIVFSYALFYVTKIPADVFMHGTHPSDLTWAGAAIFFPAMALMWYLLSCFIMNSYKKMKKK